MSVRRRSSRPRPLAAAVAAALAAAAVLPPAPTSAAPPAATPSGTARAAAPGVRATRAPVDYDAAAARVRRLLAELVAADTTNPPGNEARAARIGKAWLARAGIPAEITTFAPGRQNLVARLRGSGRKRPLLLIAHTDVVGARGQAWSTNPYQLVEKDGYLYGRGVADDLGMAAVALEVVRLLKRSGARLDRDVILAWTGDEESGGQGIAWLLQNRRASVDAELALNEGGYPVLDEHGQLKIVALQVAEKVYQDFALTTTGPTGHSSVPLADNAVYRLARALDRLSRHRFPVRLLPVTRAFFAGRARRERGELARAMRALGATRPGATPPAWALRVVERDPVLAANLRTTCVATLVNGGTRANALPASAEANVNCRILPDQSTAEVQRELARVIADPAVRLRPKRDFRSARPSPLEGPGPEAIRRVAAQLWPGVPVVPFLSRGATDSRHLRAAGIASYGISPIANRESDGRRAHGIDERIPVASLRRGVELLHRLVLELAGAR